MFRPTGFEGPLQPGAHRPDGMDCNLEYRCRKPNFCWYGTKTHPIRRNAADPYISVCLCRRPISKVVRIAGNAGTVCAQIKVRARSERSSQVQQIASRGINYLSNFFAQPFPFPKYDMVLIPGLAYGGMEHAGATFLREESVLFRTAPTHSDLLNRDILVLHELTHQWFGNLVTMRWFDDLWLKEGFAEYMAYQTLAALEPGESVWKRFYESIKPDAYAIDSTKGTTPIYQEIPNLDDAKSAYGAIVYSKAPAVLKQLGFVLGADKFREGLRLYLKQYAYGNAEWNDLVHAFESVSGRSLGNWAEMWIRHRGMPQVDVSWSCAGDRLGSVSLSQHDVLGSAEIWPVAMQLGLNYANRDSVLMRVELNAKSIHLSGLNGASCPSFIFANEEDYSYGRFLLDSRSRDSVSRQLGGINDLFRRTMLWGSLWDSARNAQLAPRDYLDLVLKLLPGETDETLVRGLLSHSATALHRYVSPATRREYVLRFEALAADRMLHSESPDLRIAWFRSLEGNCRDSARACEIESNAEKRARCAGSGDPSLGPVESRGGAAGACRSGG